MRDVKELASSTYSRRREPATVAVIGLRLAVACAVLMSAGCSSSPVLCSLELRSVLWVDVVDAQTMTSAAASSTVIVTSPTFRDSITVSVTSPPFEPPTAYIWYEDKVGPGVYSVTVTKANYQPWSMSGIRLVSDGCHVTPLVHLTAKLIATGA